MPVQLPRIDTGKSKDKFTKSAGWKIERKYDNQTLIHNWVEERMQREKAAPLPRQRVSNYDWVHCKPDVIVGKRSNLGSKGVQKEILLGLDSTELNRGSITMYDQNYNGRRPWNAHRKWDGKQLCWYPEMSDYPLRGEGTRWGLTSNSLQRFQEDSRYDSQPGYQTSYMSDFSCSS